MSDAIRSPKTLLGEVPDLAAAEKPHLIPLRQTLRDMMLAAFAALCRVLSGITTSDGTSGSTIALYRIDVASGQALVNSIDHQQATAADEVILGAGQSIESYALDGSAAAALSADGKSYEIALCLIDVNGTPTLVCVFGDEADDGSEAAPTISEIQTALGAAGITDYAGDGGLVVGRILIQRVATDTINMTHADPSSDQDLAYERAFGSIPPHDLA